MPCMRNGRPVPGNKGTCPTGSYWSDTQGDGSLNEWADVGNFLKRRYTTEDGDINALNLGLDALIFIPGLGWTARGAMAGGKGLAGLMGRMFTKGKMKNEVTKKQILKDPKKWENFTGPIPSSAYKTTTIKTKVPVMKTNRKGVEEQVRQFAPVKSAVTAGIGAQGADFFMPFTPAGIAAKEQRDANAAALATKKTEDEAVIKSAEEEEAAKVQAEKDRVANLSFTEKMKEPGYWDETDATGLTRIQRLGQLMTYYGQTPKQRAATTSPADRWAEMTTENMATAASIEKALGTDSVYSKINSKTGRSAIARKVKQAYGNTWIPGDVMFGGRANDEQLESITDEIYSNVVTLAESYPLLGSNQLYLLAKKQYDEDQLK